MIDYHTVHLPTPMPSKAPDTYRDKMIARFGRVPSMAELARMEQGLTTAHRSYVPPPPDNPNTAAMRAAIVAKGEATRADIMRVLTKPMTAQDLSTALKRTPQLIRRHLQILATEGRVTGRNVKGITVWEAK